MKYLDYILKHNIILLTIYKLVFNFLFRNIGRFISINPKLILFNSYMGKLFNDSPKVLYEMIKNDKKYKDYECVWAFKEPQKYNDIGCKVIKQDSITYFYYTLKAKYWITNVNIERGLHYKKKETIYVNTWHGTGPKIVGNAQTNRNDYDFSNIDILTTDGAFGRDILIKDFKANPRNIFLFGRPREDKLFKYLRGEVSRAELLVRYKLRPDKKYILYAPTWRDSDNNGKNYSLKLDFDLNKWTKVLGEECVILFRAHSITNDYCIDSSNKNIIDVTDWPDINDLYIIADILISDYSSCFTDYSILTKPIICFAPDYEEYKLVRGLYYDLNNFFTYGVIKDEDVLLNILKNLDILEENINVKRYKNHFVECNGDAAEKVLSKMFSL